MAVLTFVIATTITMSANLPQGNYATKPTTFTSNEVINTIMVQSSWQCHTPAATKQIDDIKKSIEGTKVAKVISTSCS